MFRKMPLILIGIMMFLALFESLKSIKMPQDTVARLSDEAFASKDLPQATGTDFRAAPASLTPSKIGAFGILEPISENIDLAGEVPGTIQSILVKEGDKIKKGQTLVVFKQNVEKTRRDAAHALLQGAKYRASLTSKNKKRTLELKEGGAATPEEFDRAQTLSLSDLSEVSAAQARYDETEAVLERLSIKSPTDGEVLKVYYQEGEYFNPQELKSILTVGDTSKLQVRLELDERDLGRLDLTKLPLYKGSFTLEAYPEKSFEFKLTRTSRSMGRKSIKRNQPGERIDTDVLEVLGELPPSVELIPGLRVTAYIDQGQLQK